MTLIVELMFPPIIPNGSLLWTPEAFELPHAHVETHADTHADIHVGRHVETRVDTRVTRTQHNLVELRAKRQAHAPQAHAAVS